MTGGAAPAAQREIARRLHPTFALGSCSPEGPAPRACRSAAQTGDPPSHRAGWVAALGCLGGATPLLLTGPGSPQAAVGGRGPGERRRAASDRDSESCDDGMGGFAAGGAALAGLPQSLGPGSGASGRAPAPWARPRQIWGRGAHRCVRLAQISALGLWRLTPAHPTGASRAAPTTSDRLCAASVRHWKIPHRHKPAAPKALGETETWS